METGFRPVPRPAPAETDADRFRKLLQASHPCIFIQTLEEAEAAELLRKAAIDQRLSTPSMARTLKSELKALRSL